MSTRRAVSTRRFKEQKELAKTPTRSTPINDRESIKTEQLNKIIEKHREEERKRKKKKKRKSS